jgi:Mg2+ and Co2+ transporter CorA
MQVIQDQGAIKTRQQAAQFAAALQRNRTLQLNLHISIATTTLAALAVIGGIFGMNLENGLETTPGLFWQVTFC